MYSSLNVHNYLQEQDVPHEFFKLAGPVANVSNAAIALGLEPGQVAVSEACYLDDEPHLIIYPSNLALDEVKLLAVSGCTAMRHIPEEAIAPLTGFFRAVLPPVGHMKPLPTFIDYQVLKEDVVYAACGEHTAVLKIRSYDLVRATNGETVDITAVSAPDA